MPHRFSISLAQLLLLAMLSALLCVWLPETVRLNRQSVLEVPKRLDCLLSQDDTVFYSRSGEQGFAAFDTRSGECLHSEGILEWTAVVFDPSSKQVAVFSILPDERYAARVIQLETGLAQYAVAPLPRPSLRVNPWLMNHPDYLPFVRGNRIYDIPLSDRTSTSNHEYDHHLRCWNVADGKEIFCVPLDTGREKVEKYRPDVSGKFYYLVTTEHFRPGGFVKRKKLVGRDLQTGQIQSTMDFSEDIDNADAFAFCHRSHNLAASVTNFDVHHNEVIQDDSEIYLTSLQGAPKRIAAIQGLQISRIAFEENDETIWHLGVRTNGTQVLTRRNVEHGYNFKTYDVGKKDAALVTGFKLLAGEKEVALAADDGSFRVLDVETGKELRRLTGLKYSPSYRQLWILAGVSIVWLILWWLATRPGAETPPRLVRLLGYAVFLAGFAQGLFLLGICDKVHHLHQPTMLVAIVIPSLIAFTGVTLLFDARCHKVTIIYGVLACTGMMAYTIWLAGQLQ